MLAIDTYEGELHILVAKLEYGYAMFLCASADGESTMFGSGENNIIAYKAMFSSPEDIMKAVRTVSDQVMNEDYSRAELFFSRESFANLNIIAGFDMLTARVVWVDEGAGEIWQRLRRASEPVSFMTRYQDLTMMRRLAVEREPDVMQAPSGQVLVKEGREWVVVDPDYEDDIINHIIPKSFRGKGQARATDILKFVLKFSDREVAHNAVDEYIENSSS